MLAKWLRWFDLNIISFLTRRDLSTESHSFPPHRPSILDATQNVLWSVMYILCFEKLFCLLQYLQEL